jgi:hypothetical protein
MPLFAPCLNERSYPSNSSILVLLCIKSYIWKTVMKLCHLPAPVASHDLEWCLRPLAWFTHQMIWSLLSIPPLSSTLLLSAHFSLFSSHASICKLIKVIPTPGLCNCSAFGVYGGQKLTTDYLPLFSQRWSPFLCPLDSGLAYDRLNQYQVGEVMLWTGSYCFLPFATQLPHCEEAHAAPWTSL